MVACAGCSYDIAETSRPTARPAPRLALADAALLHQQPAPDCDYKGVSASAKQVSGGSASDGDANNDARTTLDYERQCYKHAEMIARAKLTKLQAAVKQTAQRSERADAAARRTTTQQ